MDANISTAALMVWVSSAWLHLSFPPFPACILQLKAVDPVLCITYYFRTCNCRPNYKRKCRPKSVELMDGSHRHAHSSTRLDMNIIDWDIKCLRTLF